MAPKITSASPAFLSPAPELGTDYRVYVETPKKTEGGGPFPAVVLLDGDFFFEPLESAAAIVVPQVREYPDMLANLIASAGEDPARFPTASAMAAELCSTSAAVMALLLQAHAEGLGACWMAGPMVARDEIHALLGIAAPWRMLGAVALGHPVGPAEPKPRKPLGRVAQWFEEDGKVDD